MPWSYRPALDGLRSVAVYLVLLFHAGIPWAGGGFIGVDLFFVLSGFLVTNVILSELDETGRLRLGRFYARRVRRLLPAAVLVIVCTSVAFVLITPVIRRLPLVGDAQSALLYVANWRFLLQDHDYFATGYAESPFLHFWSLAIEEQFYLFFPLLLILVVKLARRRILALVSTLSVLMVLSVASQVYSASFDVSRAYYATDARLYQLLAGALLAVVLRSRAKLTVSPHALRTLGLLGLAGLVVLGSGLVDLNTSARGMAAAAAAVALLAALTLAPKSLLARGLSLRTPVYLGRISYGTYLWHWPVILMIEELLRLGPNGVATLALGISSALAALSYEILETPLRARGFLDRFRWSAVVAGVSVSTVVALASAPLLSSDRPPALPVPKPIIAMSASELAPIPDDIDWTKVFNDRGRGGSCPASKPRDCIVADAGEERPHILVVGDSQAGMFGPMFVKLAEDHDLTLSFNIVPGCAWQSGAVNFDTTTSTRATCDAARAGWYSEALPKLDPDLVVLITKPRDDGKWAKRFRAGHLRDGSVNEMYLRTSTETLDLLESLGQRSLVLESLLMPSEMQPLNCLASASTTVQCRVPVQIDRPVTDAYYRMAAERSPDVYSVGVNSVLCPDFPVCEPILDGTVVWRDKSHITPAIAVDLRNQIWQQFGSTGALAGIA